MQGLLKLGIGIGCAAATAGACNAAVILQAGGWEAEVDDLLAPSVSLTSGGYDPQTRTLTVAKAAVFNTVSDLTGLPDSIVITWRQVADDADTAMRIVIDQELVTNSTGLDWVGFEMTAQDSGDAAFNQALSAGFTISPFTNRTYSMADTVVTFDGGTVGAGTQWSPGQAGGELVIDVDLSRDPAMTFSLKELPLIPAPGGAAAAGAALLLLTRRRRSQ